MSNSQPDPMPDSVEYITRIREQYASLSKNQKKIASYLLAHPDDTICSSITLLAKKTGTTPSTITRFCQALSYKGYSELKLYMEKHLLSETGEVSPIQRSDPLPVVLQKLMNSARDTITDTLRTLNPVALSHTVDSIFSAKTIHLYGQSGGYVSALYGQQMLLRAGILSQAFHDVVDMDLAASALTPGDIAIGIAYSGEIRSVIDALTAAKRKKVFIVVITATPGSSMAKLADETLFYSHNIPDDLQYHHLGSMCEISILGAIQAEILRRTAESQDMENTKKTLIKSRVH